MNVIKVYTVPRMDTINIRMNLASSVCFAVMKDICKRVPIPWRHVENKKPNLLHRLILVLPAQAQFALKS